MTGRVLLAAVVPLALACLSQPCTAANDEDESALAYVEKLYTQTAPGSDATYTPRQDEIYNECLERAQGEYDLCPGINMFVMAREATPTNLEIESLSDDDKTAEVKASFHNGERDVVVVISLIHDEEGGWMVEEMTSDCLTLTDALNWKPKC